MGDKDKDRSPLRLIDPFEGILDVIGGEIKAFTARSAEINDSNIIVAIVKRLM